MAAYGLTRHCVARFMDIDSSVKCSYSSPSAIAKTSVRFPTHHKIQELGSLSMNGCGGDSRIPLGTVETRTFPAALTPALASDRLNSAIYDLKNNPPTSDSGIIRIEEN